MQLYSFFTAPLAINSYLIVDEEKKIGALIDPTLKIEEYISRSIQEGIEIVAIFETHVHADFVSGALEVKRALNNKPLIYSSSMGGPEWIPSYADCLVAHLDEIFIGSIRLQALHTPGHTQEHLVWLLFDEKRSKIEPMLAFTGDLLFVGGVGRPDLLGLEKTLILSKLLYRSLFDVLYPLPDYIEIYPAHGLGSLCGKVTSAKRSSTLGYEKKCNPQFIQEPYSLWAKKQEILTLPHPKYFDNMKVINILGQQDNLNDNRLPKLTNEQIKGYLSTKFFLDIRPQEAFSLCHIQGSINIPYAPAFLNWAGSVLGENTPLILVGDNPSLISEAKDNLKLIGFHEFIGYFQLNFLSEEEKQQLCIETKLLNTETLKANLNDYYILDVRTDNEWNNFHIEGSHHLELTKARDRLDTLPSNKPIAVICQSGNRASIIASMLAKMNKGKVFNVRGGINGWRP